MRTLSAAELIETWERGFGQHPVDRALTLLAACSGETFESLAGLSIGRRDARLLEMYEHFFGPALDAYAECPHCGERLEYRLSTRDLLVPAHRDETSAGLTFSAGTWTLRLRLPNSLDLQAASQCGDLAAGRTLLMKRCIVEARQGESLVATPDLPEATQAQVAAYLAEADPQAEMLINLACLACRQTWQVVLDIECFLWAKINSLAKRLLREVHILARAYGWREAEILALSATRRQIYLELVRP